MRIAVVVAQVFPDAGFSAFRRRKDVLLRLEPISNKNSSTPLGSS